ncbi:MAG: LysR family transcriptional regulator [Deltaproteobacteria bacterium]|nr:MAG: LysR family transcriptional regulator [Deltaproteobacteria bacterium]
MDLSEFHLYNLVMNFSFKQLEVFCKIVETGSFSKAAEEVFLTQSSVSERISNLEKIIGAKLFDRLGRRIILTDIGRFLYERAKGLLEERERIGMEIQDFLGIRRGELRIGGSTIPGEYILPRVLRQFHNLYPLIGANLMVSDSKKIQDMVLDGSLHLGIVGFISNSHELEQIRLWQDELVVAIPRDHKWGAREEIEWEELIKEPFILRERGSGTLRVMEEYLKGYPQFPKDLNIVARLGSSTAIKEGVKAGIGASIISIKALETEIRGGFISVVRIRGIKMIRHFYLIRDKRRSKSPLVDAFIKFLIEEKDDEQL